jgi:hypothetical protein
MTEIVQPDPRKDIADEQQINIGLGTPYLGDGTPKSLRAETGRLVRTRGELDADEGLRPQRKDSPPEAGVPSEPPGLCDH